jgi:hypothetical protein
MGESKTTTTVFMMILILITSLGLEISVHPQEYKEGWLSPDTEFQNERNYEYQQEDINKNWWSKANLAVDNFVQSVVSPFKIVQLFGRALIRSAIPYGFQVGYLETEFEWIIVGLLQFFQLIIGIIQGITMWRIFRRD